MFVQQNGKWVAVATTIEAFKQNGIIGLNSVSRQDHDDTIALSNVTLKSHRSQWYYHTPGDFNAGWVLTHQHTVAVQHVLERSRNNVLSTSHAILVHSFVGLIEWSY